MAPHDYAYKNLFSHPQMVRDLLEGFVCGDWLEDLDYESLEKVNSTYVADNLRGRADDLVWRAKWGREWVYVYLLMEFQSSVDPFMAVRMLSYVGLLYQDLLKTEQFDLQTRLPRVLPIVLYNGSVRWYAEQDISDLIQTTPRALDAYCPQLRYLLIDEGRHRDSDDRLHRNLVAALFKLEHSRTLEEARTAVKTLFEWLSDPGQLSLRRALRVWLNRVILPRLPLDPTNTPVEFPETRMALGERLDEFAEILRQEGEALIVLRQLEKRFGQLPSEIRVRVQAARRDQLEQWCERLLDVDSLADVFTSAT